VKEKVTLIEKRDIFAQWPVMQKIENHGSHHNKIRGEEVCHKLNPIEDGRLKTQKGWHT